MTRLQAATAAVCPLHAAGSVLASDSSLAGTKASYWSEEAGSYAAAVSPGTAVAFDLHWENQSRIKDQHETGNTFLIATSRQHPHKTRQLVFTVI